jgi:ketosteroid isomerase-like protein
MDPESERSRLLMRDAEWAALASEGRDVEAILSYWTDDAVVMPAGARSIVGKPALREYVESSLRIPGFSITWKTSDAVVSATLDFAYLFSDNVVTVQGDDGSNTSIPGRGVTIWRKEPDGEWRCAVDIWNAPPAD